MLYDQLVKDLRKAAAAIEESRAEDCANSVKHALLVIQQLEGSMDHTTESELVNWLVRFYSLLRSRIVAAQVSRSPEEMHAQIAMILDVREAWQQIESRSQEATPGSQAMSTPSRDASMSFNSVDEFRTSTWSA